MTPTACPTLDVHCVECGWSDEMDDARADDLDCCPHCCGSGLRFVDIG